MAWSGACVTVLPCPDSCRVLRERTDGSRGAQRPRSGKAERASIAAEMRVNDTDAPVTSWRGSGVLETDDGPLHVA
jgi:hypothetical protein